MAPHFYRLNQVIEPGLNSIGWLSVNIQSFIDEVYVALGEFELLIDRANEIVEYRVLGAMNELTAVTLCELPTDEPWSVEYFVDHTQVGGSAT